MATFEAQVEGITGIAIASSGTNPTQAELHEFLREGVIDVTNRTLSSNPRRAQDFQRESSVTDSQGLDIKGAKIIGVMRERNGDGSSDGTTLWEECRYIPPTLQSRVVDVNSLHYASMYNPVYMIDGDSLINVYPVPSSNNGYRAFYVNNIPTASDDATTNFHTKDGWKYFPNELEPLVVIYASIKTLENTLANWIQEEEDLELTQATNVHLTQLKQQYDNAFIMAAQGTAQQAEASQQME
tara:strand:+ start:7410 stop:8132 length:723 start_codon:yes stop_codon:yes gene_type:complete